MSHTTEKKKERKSDLPNTDSLYLDGNRAKNTIILVNRFADGHRERRTHEGWRQDQSWAPTEQSFLPLSRRGGGGSLSAQPQLETLSVRPSLLLSGSHTAREHIRLPSDCQLPRVLYQRLHEVYRVVPPGNTHTVHKSTGRDFNTALTYRLSRLVHFCVHGPVDSVASAGRSTRASRGRHRPAQCQQRCRQGRGATGRGVLTLSVPHLTWRRRLVNCSTSTTRTRLRDLAKTLRLRVRALAQDRQRDIGSFRDTDRDHSGTISWGEFATMWNASIQYEATHATVHNEAARLKTAVSAAAHPVTNLGAREGVLEQKAFSAAYRLSRSLANHTIINLSNNHIGSRILGWIDRFDPVHSMKHLVAQECALDDRSIVRLAGALREHPNIERLDLRGNPIRGRGLEALLQLVKKNRNIIQVEIDENGLYGSSVQKCNGIRRETAMNRRSLGTAHRVRRTLLPPVKDALYTAGDVAHRATQALVPRQDGSASGSQRPLSSIMLGLIAAKVKAARKWRKSVSAGKERRRQQKSSAKDVAQRDLLVASGLNLNDRQVDFRNQVNLDMYSDDALRQRSALREHPEIKACCHRWWNCLIIPVIDSDHSGTISKEEYLVFHKCLNFALTHEEKGRMTSLPPIGSAAATKLALEDWENDAKGGEKIDAETFELAIFELADIWTDTTDPQEYVDFLDWLFSEMVVAMSQPRYHRDPSFCSQISEAPSGSWSMPNAQKPHAWHPLVCIIILISIPSTSPP